MKVEPKDKHKRATEPRGGVAAVEGAIVLGSLFVVLFGMLDLSLLVLESNTAAEASRRLCRTAVVHGQMASPQMTIWGPATVTGNAGDGTEYAQALNPELVTFDLSNVNYTINWLDAAISRELACRSSSTSNINPSCRSLWEAAPSRSAWTRRCRSPTNCGRA